MTQRQPNRAERRRMMKDQSRQIRKTQKLVGKNNPHIFISCPDCKSRDVKHIGKDSGQDYFRCNKCGSTHELSEMDVEL